MKKHVCTIITGFGQDHHRLWAGSSQALGRIITGFGQDHHRLWATLLNDEITQLF